MKQVILGQIPSKSNSYIIVGKGQFAKLAKKKDVYDYEKNFYLQCNNYRNKAIKGLFELHIDVYNASQRPDLDNALKICLDCLQACNAIVNDRNCVKIVASKFVDKEHPHIEFEIVEL